MMFMDTIIFMGHDHHDGHDGDEGHALPGLYRQSHEVVTKLPESWRDAPFREARGKRSHHGRDLQAPSIAVRWRWEMMGMRLMFH